MHSTNRIDNYKTIQLISRLQEIVSKEGILFSDNEVEKIAIKLKNLNILKNLGFVCNFEKWNVEYEWEGYDYLNSFFDNLPHPKRAYKLWIELFTGLPYYSWTKKPIWWSITVKPTKYVVESAPKIVGKLVLLINGAKYFGKDGYKGNDHFVNGTVAKFRKMFVEDLNQEYLGVSRKQVYIDLRKELFSQFKNEFKNNQFRRLIKRKQRPNLFVLKYQKDKFHYSWVRKYIETNRRYAWRSDKGIKPTIKFFSQYNYSKWLKANNFNYIITSSEITFDELIDEYLNNRINSLHDVNNALMRSRSASRIIINGHFGTKDVKPPLIVDTTNIAKYKDESNPEGQITIIQSLFQLKKNIKKLNREFNIDIPLNGCYRFMAQSRGRTATTTTNFEDISASSDKYGYPLEKSVNIFVKNSSEISLQRLIEDRLMKMLSFPKKELSIPILVDVTHPEDINPEELPKEVKNVFKNYNWQFPLGWIDIGIYKRSEVAKDIASIYGAIKYSRKKNLSNNHINTAEQMLLGHNITGVHRNLIEKMDKLFDIHQILNCSPRDLSLDKFTHFTIDFIKKFLIN
ncbi:MAG: hypothetical protein ACW964_12040 [Candidatus Hodarchaeales archaeon]|jgi:hypothetical protein